jgi:hypothetical protein
MWKVSFENQKAGQQFKVGSRHIFMHNWISFKFPRARTVEIQDIIQHTIFSADSSIPCFSFFAKKKNPSGKSARAPFRLHSSIRRCTAHNNKTRGNQYRLEKHITSCFDDDVDGDAKRGFAPVRCGGGENPTRSSLSGMGLRGTTRN